jgi:hypothetical protein
MEMLKESIIPIGFGIISWLIKDLLIKSAIKRDEAARTEWEYRLKEIWSPLFYWSGIISLSDDVEGWQKHGIAELEHILSKSAHLLPLNHYYTLVRMIEGITNQKTTRVTLDETKRTRDYVYRQVELLNYLVYRRERIYEADVAVDVMAPYRFLLRAASGFFLHLFVWAVIAAIIIGFYFSYSSGVLWPIYFFAIPFFIIILIDIKNRFQIYKDIRRMLSE